MVGFKFLTHKSYVQKMSLDEMAGRGSIYSGTILRKLQKS